MPVWVIITGSKWYAVCLLITTFHVDHDEGWTDTKRASEREKMNERTKHPLMTGLFFLKRV